MSDNPYLSAFKKCDIVMKGGVTSGIVYPRAVTRLAQEYCFQSIGGTSAGAIAAALTAAAEYRRRNGEIVFEEMDKIPDWLGSPSASGDGSNLFHLFQPQKSMTGLFRVASAFVAYSGLRRYWTLVSALWLDALAGALPGVAVIWLLWCIHLFTGLLLGSLIGLVGLLLGAVLGVVLRAARLPKNRFGLCTGYEQPSPGKPVTLTEWLNNQINTLARHPGEKPVTFGDLRRAGVTLKMISTCLTLGRPYTMPFDTNEFYFSPDEMRLYFPKTVVDWMVQHAGKVSEHHDHVDTHGFVPLPEADDLPVIVATRFSLSFPLLFCAVPLYAVDWTRRRRTANEPVPSKRVPGDALGHDEPRRPEVVWFSDGGICSNFPLHLFDSPLPRWPTFGLNLRATRADYSYDHPKDHVWMPTGNLGGIAQEWNRWTSAPGAALSFAGSIVDSARNWTDTLQTMVPGYRDRIAHIYLNNEQGGLNLNMPDKVVKDIAGYGGLAAEKLADRFLRGTDDGAPTPMTWDNQRWIRYRSTMEVVADFLSRFSESLKQPESGDRSYVQLVERGKDAPPGSYRFDQEQLGFARDITHQLADLGQEIGDCDLAKNAPRPRPALRVRPQF
jgi:predicted acylesterase/phospholipase RssA